MLTRRIQQIVDSNPDYGAIAAVIEKEVLHHDIMDVLIKQRGTAISAQLVDKKLEARGKEKANFIESLGAQTERLMRDDEVRTDFNAEIARFLPNQIKMRTIDDPDYWAYLIYVLGI